MGKRWSVAACERIIGHAYRMNPQYRYWRCVYCGALAPVERVS
jgi:hypothetical protein